VNIEKKISKLCGNVMDSVVLSREPEAHLETAAKKSAP
jgi:hypothetical protein